MLQTATGSAEDPVVRQQLKWLRNGDDVRIRARSRLVNAIPYVLGIPVRRA